EYGALELVGIGQHAPDSACESRLDRDRFAQRAHEKVRHARNQSVRVDRFGLQRLAPRKCEQLARERGSASRALLGTIQEAIEFARGVSVEVPARAAPPERTKAAGDDLQKIVEVVRDAARQLPDRFHLLRLPECGFDFLAFFDLYAKLGIGCGELAGAP